MLRIIRILLAILSLLAVTALFVNVTGLAARHWAWMAQIQFIPAVLALNAAVVVGLIVLTLLLGRVYCSVICPLGIYQDVVNRISIIFSKKKTRRVGKFRFAPAKTKLRLGFLIAFIVLLILGHVSIIATSIASFIEPYSAFGRMAAFFVRPVAVDVNNVLATQAAEHGSYAFAQAAQLPFSLPLAIVASITFIVITAYAWRSGRGYCNQICPVGTILGWFAKYSWLKPVIETDKCISCGRCARKCKASCIDSKHHSIDYSRCVACMDCLKSCSEGAITYAHPKKQKAEAVAEAPDTSRRAFITGAAVIAGATAASALGKGDGGLAPLKQKQRPERVTPLVPPGSKGLRHLSAHCTACQLCISNCPNGVLTASTDFDSFMQPRMDFSNGYCRPECTQCSDVCPDGAIIPIEPEEKSSIKIGTAVVDTTICISAAYGQKCGRCSDGCPTGAIEMIRAEGGSGNLQPVVNESLCIGCGACEYHCPVGTVASNRTDHAAIHVEGIEKHRTI